MLQLGGNEGMGMLKSITLENYKCFKDRTTIDIAPLTVLCGVNSSGKSSILKSLLMMKQSVEKDTPYNKLSLMGNYVDNGYFDNVVNSSVKENDDATFTIENTFVLHRFEENQKKRQDMSSFKELRKLYSFSNNINSFIITHTITVRRGCDYDNELLDYIENNSVIETSISVAVKDRDDNFIYQQPTFVLLKKYRNNLNENFTERTYEISFQKLPVSYHFGNRFINSFSYDSNNSTYRCQCYFNNIKLTNIYQKNMSSKLLSAKSTILSLFNIVSQQYYGVEFIAPLRHNPMRTNTIKGDVSSVGISGEDAPILYAKLCENPKKHKTDVAIPIKSDNNWSIDFSPLDKDLMNDFKTSVQGWMDYFELGQVTYSGVNGLMELQINRSNISDVGFGVSQVFPIIVQGLQMSKDFVLLLEQPEIHLHPQMQMRMADFLLALSSSERNVIVETHSDHVINRLVRRLMEDDSRVLQNILKIYFLENKDDGVVINEIKTDKIKGVVDAPVQFFGQYAIEVSDIMKIGFKNIKARKMNNE